MNELAVVLLALILATILLGRDLMTRLVVIATVAWVTYILFMAATDGGAAEWFQVTVALVFVSAYGVLFSYLIWSGLKSIWNRLTVNSSEQSAE